MGVFFRIQKEEDHGSFENKKTQVFYYVSIVIIFVAKI